MNEGIGAPPPADVMPLVNIPTAHTTKTTPTNIENLEEKLIDGQTETAQGKNLT